MSESESILNNINEFYKLKFKYETYNQKNKNKILNNPTLSLKERRTEFKKIKPKCINCKRPGGTAFLIKINKDSGFRELRSFCMATERCNLNIVIQLGIIESITDALVEIKDKIQKKKETIIDTKNLLLFNYIFSNQAVDIFDKEKAEIYEWTSLLEMYLQDYILLTDNDETKTKLNISIEKSYEYIQQLRDAIKQFKITDDTQFVRDAVNIYITNLKPLLDNIQNLKYRENIVWFNEDNNTYNLIQKKLTISSLESGENNNKLIDFNVGFSGLNKSKVDESSIFESTKSDDSSQQDIIGKPTFGENNTIKWSNKEYQKIWDKLNINLKIALLTDKEWLQEFMDSCTNLRLMGKPCVFISPGNLILPPIIIHVDKDGTEKEEYDFGNKVYNDMFNNFDSSYKDTLLTLYSKKDGVKNYKMLEDALNSILEKNLGFNKGYLKY